jgi:hypothetical protein
MMHTSEADCKENGIIENVTTFRVLMDATRRALSRSKLSGKDWAIVMALLKFSHNGGRACTAGNESLAREADTVERNVQIRLGKLEEKGVVRRTTATSEEAGATHRLIELLFLKPGWRATQDSGPTPKESGACRAHDRSWGGAHDRAPNEDEKYQNNLATDAADAARGPDGAVADLPPSSSPRPPRRATRPRRPAKPQPPAKGELVAIEKALMETDGAIGTAYNKAVDEQGADTFTAEQLIGKDMPQTAAAIERLAELHGRLLGDPGGVATYRNRIARAWAIEIQCAGLTDGELPTVALRKKLVQTLRMWGWGKVKNPPAFYTKAADKLLDGLEAEINGDTPKRQTPKKTTSTPTSASSEKTTIAEHKRHEWQEAVRTGNPRPHLRTVAKARGTILHYITSRDGGRYADDDPILPANDQEAQILLTAIRELINDQEGELNTGDLEGMALDAATRRLDQYENLKEWVARRGGPAIHPPKSTKLKVVNAPDPIDVF